jgi:hypothetical protein
MTLGFLLSPDAATLGYTLLGAAGLFAGYHATRRKPVPVPVVAAPPAQRIGSTRPLAPNMLVEVISGPHAGLAGWVREVCLLTWSDGDGISRVKIELNDGRFLWAERDDVAPLA